MPRHFMHIAFRGAAYHGWQTQPGEATVQGAVERALATILRRPVAVTGAGRTDAGVNATMMPAHLDLPSGTDTGALIHALNSLLGPDIAVYSLTEVHPDAHARFDATSRTYHYRAVTRKSPFDYPLTWQAPPKLDFDAMNRAAQLLLQTSDFTSFAKLHSDTRTNICRVTRAQWVPDPATGGMTFVITADRFLRNMVRAIVGTLVEVGRGKIDTNGFAGIIASHDRCSAGTSMPGQALFLHRVTYDYWSPATGFVTDL